MADKIALISDVHSNLFALEAVLSDCHKQGVSKIYFLGDVIGYGPKPIECLDLLMKECEKLAVLGNHDAAFLGGLDFGWDSAIKAKNAIIYARNLLNYEKYLKNKISNKYIDWLLNLKPSFRLDENLFVHGSPRDQTYEYLTSHNLPEYKNIFNEFKHLCFVAHSHIPGLFARSDKLWYAPKDINHQYFISDDKAVINIGSVGQPRDEDPRACYGIFDGSVFIWRRVEYNIQGTIQQILDIPELDDWLGHRLLAGK